MSHIRVLSEQTINQIAAGEVIENPASVVKEVVENALDAGASQVVIEIKGGGFQMIRIADNGCGMDRDDAVLCFERHATSKIKDSEDLITIRTMGFRGEALASIAAISQLTLTTAQKEGTKVEIEGGKMRHVGPAPRTHGTTVEVRSLFYNVPARKKFQKSAQASNVEIHRLVTILSLAHPEVSFELINNDVKVFSAQGYPEIGFLDRLRLRMKEVLGENFSGVCVDSEGVKGYLGGPHETRPNRSGQFLFINKRVVSSPLISFAVREAFGTRIDADRFPIYVLHLDMPGHLVDVNVHPQKKEVRFQDESTLKRKILEAISGAFGTSRPTLFSSAPVSFNSYETGLIFREEAPKQSEPLPFENEATPIGIYEHFLLLDAASIDGYEKGVIVVDLLAVQERLALHELQSQEHPIVSQGLLLPIKIDLHPAEAQAVEGQIADLEKMGFSVSLIGKNTFSVEAIPSFLAHEDVADAIMTFVHAEDGPKVLARFARRQKKVFMLQEGLALWKKVKMVKPLPGQPIMAYLDTHAITKLFTP